jgi:hypothetical protein
MDQDRIGKPSVFERFEYKLIYLLYTVILALVVEYCRMLYLRWRMVTAPLTYLIIATLPNLPR